MVVEVGLDRLFGVLIELQDELFEDSVLDLVMLDHFELVFQVAIFRCLILVQNEFFLPRGLPISRQVIPVLFKIVGDFLFLFNPLSLGHVTHKRRLFVDLVVLVDGFALKLIALLKLLLHLSLVRVYFIEGLGEGRCWVRGSTQRGRGIGCFVGSLQ